MILDRFIEAFADVFYDRLVGERIVDIGVPVVFTGPCGLTSQLAMETHVSRFRGFVARYGDYESFGDLLREASRASIDRSIRMVVVPEVHSVPPTHLKRLCSLSNVWVIACGKVKPSVPSLFQVEVVAPSLSEARVVIAEELGVEDEGGEFDTIGEFLAACDGLLSPSVALKSPADTAHRLVASGGPTGYICRVVFKHAIKNAKEKNKHKIAEAAAECDAEMARCRRPLVLSKVLEYYLRQIAKYSSSE